MTKWHMGKGTREGDFALKAVALSVTLYVMRSVGHVTLVLLQIHEFPSLSLRLDLSISEAETNTLRSLLVKKKKKKMK